MELTIRLLDKYGDWNKVVDEYNVEMKTNLSVAEVKGNYEIYLALIRYHEICEGKLDLDEIFKRMEMKSFKDVVTPKMRYKIKREF